MSNAKHAATYRAKQKAKVQRLSSALSEIASGYSRKDRSFLASGDMMEIAAEALEVKP